MKCVLSASLGLLLASASFAQSKANDEAVGKLPQEFCDAWVNTTATRSPRLWPRMSIS